MSVEGFLRGRIFTDKRSNMQLMVKPECELYVEDIAEYFSKAVQAFSKAVQAFDDRVVSPSYVFTPPGLYWRRIRGGNMWKRGRSRRK